MNMMSLFLLGILFLLFFTVLYDIVDITVKKERDIVFTISLTLFEFSFKKEDSDKKAEPSAILSRIRDLPHCLKYILPRTDITLSRFFVATVPKSPKDTFAIASRLTLASVLIGYFKNNARRFSAKKEATSLFAPMGYDGEIPALEATFSTRLFCLIIFLVFYLYYTVKRKRGKRYDRKQNKRYTSRIG